ncbi:glycosyltransferase family 22 protein [Jaapia argillacea MUCL 33604]|uniref:Mannosyltransferase n=1 Tax=Jaapia argillacea MUCL 33604 TaxID=933084 RepID=A0A067QAM8_9AGAM|nr:glycosyltransferase family 22 protein [Jaapia argillacea MUCL 33604]
MSANVQNLRFRRPLQNAEPSPAKPVKLKEPVMLHDQVRKTAKPAWTPSFSMAIRLLLLVRVSAAMYSNIQDCDEVYNFWEPLHYLDKGYGFQTWEVSPVYAIRSWAYILLHVLPARIPSWLAVDKRMSFFAVRIFLAFICTFCEAKFYRSVTEKVNRRVGRYMFFMLFFSAGMWNASTAFLPSSFAMYAIMYAFSYAMEPTSENHGNRTLFTTVCFAAGAILGWPFALAIAIPFVFEELFVYSGDHVPSGTYSSWLSKRWLRLFASGVVSSLLFVYVVGVDSLAYGRLSIVPWNIVRYNIFGGSSRGPDLYGTEPWYFYILNLLLNFNIIFPISLISLPALGITYLVDRKRLGYYKSSPEQSSPFTVLALRLAPLYLWLGILTSQAHKEERFMYPAYPLICFNAAVALYLMRGWLETVFIKITKSPYQASRTSIFRTATSSVVCAAVVLSISRIMALWHYYHAPLSVTYSLTSVEMPRLLNVTGYLPTPPPHVTEEELPRIDLSPIKEFGLTLCLGKEWYRFPGHYLVPDGVRVEFVKSEFEGLLPGHFWEGKGRGSGLWWRRGTRVVPQGLNDLNKEEPTHYVDVNKCHYLLDLDFPDHPVSSVHEPRYSVDSDNWERVYCAPFLDARHSSLLTRTLWAPGKEWRALNSFGDYCLLKNRPLVTKKEVELLVKQANVYN